MPGQLTKTHTHGCTFAFFGSSLVSAYWNGAATYYRGIIKALHHRGHSIDFYEPDAFERQAHRDIPDPSWAKVTVYEPLEKAVYETLRQASGADVIVKASGVGVFDRMLEREIPLLKKKDNLIVFWDVDAPATLDRLESDSEDPFHRLVPEYDLVFTYGGGPPVVSAYEKAGAKKCFPIYNALDTSTHYPVESRDDFSGECSFLGNRLPDRERRVEEFFMKPACLLPAQRFVLGGSGWYGKEMPANVRYVGHVYTRDHNAFNCTPKAVLNISRESMARYGYSPATRVFEAAGAGACIITDEWEGIDSFLEPGEQILVAENGKEVAEILGDLTLEKAMEVGRAAYLKIISDHTYDHRADHIEQILSEYFIHRKKTV